MSESMEGLTCSICSESYDLKIRIPKLLHCFHTFCNLCCQSLEKEKKIPCPTCRGLTTVPLSGLSANFALLDILQESKQDVISETMCELCDENKVANKCLECKQGLCQQCSKSHQRATSSRHHNIVAISSP